MEVRSDSEQCAKSVDSTVMDVDKASADDQLVPNGNEIELENDCDSGTEENGHEDDGEQAEANRPVRMNKEQSEYFQNISISIKEITFNEYKISRFACRSQIETCVACIEVRNATMAKSNMWPKRASLY